MGKKEWDHADYLRHRDERLEKQRRYYQEHRDLVLKYAHAYGLKNREKIRERRHRQGVNRPMSQAKDSSVWLGVYIAESALSKFFNNIHRMPYGNPGYDFICGKGFKIDVKSACARLLDKKYMGWTFHIKHNTLADYFLCVAFDNRETLAPRHIWLIPGHVINAKRSISILESTAHKWSCYERALDNVLVCCDVLRTRDQDREVSP